MDQASREPRERQPGLEPELEAALEKVLRIVDRDHPLSPNQILALSSELQRLGVERLVEEHVRRFRRRQGA